MCPKQRLLQQCWCRDNQHWTVQLSCHLQARLLLEVCGDPEPDPRPWASRRNVTWLNWIPFSSMTSRDFNECTCSAGSFVRMNESYCSEISAKRSSLTDAMFVSVSFFFFFGLVSALSVIVWGFSSCMLFLGFFLYFIFSILHHPYNDDNCIGL